MPARISINQFREAASGKWNKGSVVLDEGNKLKRINNHIWSLHLNNVKSDPKKNHDVRQAFYESVRDFLQGRLGVGNADSAHNIFLAGLHERLLKTEGDEFLTRKEIDSILDEVDRDYAFRLDDANVQNDDDDDLALDRRQTGAYNLLRHSWKYSEDTGLNWKTIRRICKNEGDAVRFLTRNYLAQIKDAPENVGEHMDINAKRKLAETWALRQLAGKASISAETDLGRGTKLKVAFDMLEKGFPLELLKANQDVAQQLLRGFDMIAANREADLAHHVPANEKSEWNEVELGNPLSGLTLTKLKDGRLSIGYKGGGAFTEKKSVTLAFPADHYARELERTLVSLPRNVLDENADLKADRERLLANLIFRWPGGADGANWDSDHAEQLKHFRNIATIALINETGVDRATCEQIEIGELLKLARALVVNRDPQGGVENQGTYGKRDAFDWYSLEKWKDVENEPDPEVELRPTVESVKAAAQRNVSDSVEFREIRTCFKNELSRINQQNEGQANQDQVEKKAKEAVEYISELMFAAADESPQNGIVAIVRKDPAKLLGIVNDCKTNNAFLNKLTPLAKEFVQPLMDLNDDIAAEVEGGGYQLTEVAEQKIRECAARLRQNVQESISNLGEKFRGLYVSQNYFENDSLPPDENNDFLDLGRKLAKVRVYATIDDNAKSVLNGGSLTEGALDKYCMSSYRSKEKGKLEVQYRKLLNVSGKYFAKLVQAYSKSKTKEELEANDVATIVNKKIAELGKDPKRKAVELADTNSGEKSVKIDGATYIYLMRELLGRYDSENPKAPKQSFQLKNFENWIKKFVPNGRELLDDDDALTKNQNYQKFKEDNLKKVKEEEERDIRLQFSKYDQYKSAFKGRSESGLLLGVLKPELYTNSPEKTEFVTADVFDLLAATITSPEKMCACFPGDKPSVEGAYEIVNSMLKALFTSSAAQNGATVTEEDFNKAVDSLADFLSRPPAGLKREYVKAHLPFKDIRENIEKGASDLCPVFTDLLRKLPGSVVSSVLKGLCQQVIYRNLELNLPQNEGSSEALASFGKTHIDPVYEQMKAWRKDLGDVADEKAPASLKDYLKGGKKFNFKELDEKRFAEIEQAYDSNSTARANFVERLLPDYLKKIQTNPALMGRMMKQLALGEKGLPANKAFDWDFFGAVARGLGPIMQKFLQGYALPVNATDDERRVFNDLKKNLSTPSADAVNAQLEFIKKSSGGRIVDIQFKKFLGCATVGATALCTVKTSDGVSEDCVIKFLHADVKKMRAAEQELIDGLIPAVQNDMEKAVQEAINRANEKNANDEKEIDRLIGDYMAKAESLQRSIRDILPDDAKTLESLFPANGPVKSVADLFPRAWKPDANWKPAQGERPADEKEVVRLFNEELFAELVNAKEMQKAWKGNLEKLAKDSPVLKSWIESELTEFQNAVDEIVKCRERKAELAQKHKEHVDRLMVRKGVEIAEECKNLKAENAKRIELIEQELDFKNEFDSIANGLDAYANKAKGVQSVDALTYVVPDSSFLIMRLVDGKTITDGVAEVDGLSAEFKNLNRKAIAELDAKNPQDVDANDAENLVNWSADLLAALENRQKLLDSRDLLVSMSNLWFNEALGEKGSGFFHADLHSGNIMIEGDHATMIDFGNCGKLSTREKNLVHNLFVSVARGTAGVNGFMSAIRALGFLKNGELGNHTAKLTEILGEGAGTEATSPEVVFGRFAKAMDYLRNQGIVPADAKGSVNNFLQSQMRLANSLKEVNDRLYLLDQAVLSAGKEKKWYLGNWPLSAAQSKANHKGMTDHADTLRAKVFGGGNFAEQAAEFDANLKKIKTLAGKAKAIQPLTYESVVGQTVQTWSPLRVQERINVGGNAGNVNNANNVNANDGGNVIIDPNNNLNNNIININNL